VSGTPPSGRVCSTTTFTYTVRYGPYSDCAPRKSTNAASFQTVDTITRGSSQSEVYIQVGYRGVGGKRSALGHRRPLLCRIGRL
jgi:hypothetical protein